MLDQMIADWHKFVMLGDHKDDDCHFEIAKHWDYGNSPKYTVKHMGHYTSDQINQTFETHKEAQDALTEFVREQIKTALQSALSALDNEYNKAVFEVLKGYKDVG